MLAFFNMLFNFLKWFLERIFAVFELLLKTCSGREMFMRFVASAILLTTISFIFRGKEITEAWWSMLGMVLGYYFRDSESRCGSTKIHVEIDKCPKCGVDLKSHKHDDV